MHHMTKMNFKHFAASLIAAAALAAPLGLNAATTEAGTATTASTQPAAGTTTPLKGRVTAVDTAAKTFTISKKKSTSVFTITDKTVITLGRHPGTLNDLAVGGKVKVTFETGADGKMTATAVKIHKARNSTDTTKTPKA
jgi:Domain of unknown function (DUF5666)